MYELLLAIQMEIYMQIEKLYTTVDYYIIKSILKNLVNLILIQKLYFYITSYSLYIYKFYIYNINYIYI